MTDADGAIAVFGGSFDPPHVGHVLAATYVLVALPVAGVLVVPTFRHPFAKDLRPYDDRVRMCELAFADVRRVAVSRIEEELGGDSLTLRTLEELRRREPARGLRLVVGSDLVAEMPRWHGAEEIARLAPPIVLARAGHHADVEAALPAMIPDVSSRDVRARFAAGESVVGLVPDAVAEYARRGGLY